MISKADFKLNSPKKMNQRFLAVSFQPNQQTYARLGVIVGKRVSKCAVVRNKIKRIIRESFRVNQKNLLGFDIIVIARPQCDTLSKFELRKGLESLWLKIKPHFQNVLLQ